MEARGHPEDHGRAHRDPRQRRRLGPRSRVATIRQIDPDLWEDRKLDTFEEAAFFAFLFTGRRSRASGIVEATPEQLAGDLALKLMPEAILKHLAALQKKELVVYDAPWLWVLNAWKRWPTKSPLFFKHVAADLTGCQSFVIWRRWQKKYLMWMPHLKRAQGRDIEFTGVLPSRAELDLDASLPKIIADKDPRRARLLEGEIQGVWAHFEKTIRADLMLTASRRTKIVSRLGDKVKDPVTGLVRAVTAEDLKTAITNCSRSDWHMGRDPKTQGRPCNMLEDHILRSLGQLEKWLAYQTPAERKRGGHDPRHDEPEGYERVSLAPTPPTKPAPAAAAEKPPQTSLIDEEEKETVLRPAFGGGR